MTIFFDNREELCQARLRTIIVYLSCNIGNAALSSEKFAIKRLRIARYIGGNIGAARQTRSRLVFDFDC